jgi:hypothetical protein
MVVADHAGDTPLVALALPDVDELERPAVFVVVARLAEAMTSHLDRAVPVSWIHLEAAGNQDSPRALVASEEAPRIRDELRIVAQPTLVVIKFERGIEMRQLRFEVTGVEGGENRVATRFQN